MKKEKKKKRPQITVGTESLHELMGTVKNGLEEGKSIEGDQVHTKH